MWGFERLDPVRTSENSPKKGVSTLILLITPSLFLPL
jgi:hypothetical protein